MAQQKMDTAQGILSQEMRVLLEIQREWDREMELLGQALQGQAEDALRNPRNLNGWKLHIVAQKEKIRLIEERLGFQEAVVEECREALRECRVLMEKFKRLKEKKWKEYVAEEQRKEQAQLDEIGQRTGRNNKE